LSHPGVAEGVSDRVVVIVRVSDAVGDVVCVDVAVFDGETLLVPVADAVGKLVFVGVKLLV
jgi:hypothetical protein